MLWIFHLSLFLDAIRYPLMGLRAAIPSVRWLTAMVMIGLMLWPSPAASSPAARDAVPDTARYAEAQARRLFVRGLTQAFLDAPDRAIRLYERALSITPHEAPILSALADAKAAQADTSSAIFYARQARAAAPDNPHYYRQLATLQQQAGRTEEAIASYQALVERFPNDLQAQLTLADLLTDAHRAEEALRRFELLEQKMGGATPHMYMEMMQLYQRLGAPAGVERTLRALAELQPDERLFTHMLAQFYLKNGRTEAAIRVYENTLASHPNDTQMAMDLAALYREQNRPADADSILHRFADTNGASAPELVRRAEALYRQRTQQAEAKATAVRLLEQALAQSPTNEQALQLLGELRFQARQYADAARLFEKALEQNPRAPQRWYQAAAAHLRAGQSEQAVSVADEGLLLFPGQPPLVRIAAYGLMDLGRNKAAIKRFEEWLALAADASVPKNQRADVWATLGLLHNRLDDTNASDRAYERAIALQPDHVSALNNYAYSLAQRGLRLDYAEELARRAVQQAPNNAAYLDTLGWIYFQQQNYEQAKKYLGRAVASESASATVFEHYGDVHRALGNTETARTYYRKALEHAPDRAALRDKLQALQP